MTKIFLVRHAQSLANEQGIYQGVTYDTDLSEIGRKQAQILADRFEHIDITQIIASPLKRTIQTAAVVAKRKHLSIQKELSILETNHGSWEGKHKDTITKTWPWIYEKWLKFPSSTKFPDGEHFLETQKRVTGWWKEFISTNSKDTLIVSHDNIIRVIVAAVLNMKLNRIWKFHLQPTAISEVDSTNGVVKLVALGTADHLGALSVDLSLHAL